MPSISYAALPVWLQCLVGFTIILGTVVAIVATCRKFVPWFRKRIRITEALDDLPEWMKRVERTLAAQDTMLAAQGKGLAEVKHEVLPNNGGSLRDAVDRQGEHLDEQDKKLDTHTRALKSVNKKLARDDERIQHIEETAPRDELGRFASKEK